jgi:hypothetical protein
MAEDNTWAKTFCDGLVVPIDTIPPDTECSICLTVFVEPPYGQAVETECRHVFHYTCLHTWLSMSGDSCPMCRVVFYEPVAPQPANHPIDSPDSEGLLDSIEPSLLWEPYPVEPLRNARRNSTPNRAQQHMHHVVAQYSRALRRRMVLLQDLIALVQENEELSHAELQFCRRVLGGEHEQPDQDRRARLSSLMQRQGELLPEIWVMDARVCDLFSEEQRLLEAVDFDTWVALLE